MSNREIFKPGDDRAAVHVALVEAADKLVSLVCEDRRTVASLAALIGAGAVVEVRTMLPSGKVAVQLVRDGKRETLATVDPTPMRQAVN